jgi:hypothetical protein
MRVKQMGEEDKIFEAKPLPHEVEDRLLIPLRIFVSGLKQLLNFDEISFVELQLILSNDATRPLSPSKASQLVTILMRLGAIQQKRQSRGKLFIVNTKRVQEIVKRIVEMSRI